MDYEARISDVMRLADDVAKEFNAAFPSSGFKSGSAILAIAHWKKVQSEYAEPKNKRQAAIARKMAESAGYNPDEVVSGHSGPAMICRIPNGEVVAVGAMLAGALPLWHYYTGLAQAAIDADALMEH